MQPNPPLRWWTWALAWSILVIACKVYFASTLQLFGDEAFYRWESQNLAWSYSDLPPITAFSIHLGQTWFGDSLLALRSLFLVSAVALPGAIYWLALPLVGPRQALAGAGLSLLIPATATLGILAIPDSLLLTLCTLALACLERACRSGAMAWWVATGVLGCLGFLTHYRFLFLPLPLGLAFLCYPALRAHLARPGPWVAVAIAALGLIPALLFNFGNDFEALGFHFARRHPWSFHGDGLSYPLKQAVAVSPLVYGLVLLALWHSVKRALAGDTRHMLLSSVSLFYILGISLLAPWVDQTSTTIHWAWFGYIPMLVVLPGVMLELWRRGSWGRWLTGLGLALGALFVAGSLALMAASLHFEALPRALQDKVSVKMVGWDALRREVAGHYRPGETLYSSEYYVAAQLREPPFLDSRFIVLDQEKIHRDGRARQLFLWEVSQQFAPADGSSGLVVLDYETANRNEIYRQIDFVCRRFERIETLREFTLFEGRRQYGLYRGHGASEESNYQRRPSTGLCVPPLRGRVDSMAEFRTARTGVVPFRGWLLAQPEGIARVVVRIGEREIEADYGVRRGDTQRVLSSLIRDPQYPRVGFEGEIDTRQFADGRYDVDFVGITHWGREQVFKRLQLEVANRGTAR